MSPIRLMLTEAKMVIARLHCFERKHCFDLEVSRMHRWSNQWPLGNCRLGTRKASMVWPIRGSNAKQSHNRICKQTGGWQGADSVLGQEGKIKRKSMNELSDL